jgi:4-hydroxy-3-methylbut-2-en-1-yl diphosphate reductase
MKIILAQHFGVCFGVRDAIGQAERLARKAPLTILGELVHNPVVRERLRAPGVQESELETLPGGHVGQLMITAHGASNRRRAALRRTGLPIADGTCPLVRHAHEQLRELVAAGFFPVVIGQAGHVEVGGLTEDFPEAVVLGSEGDIGRLPLAASYGIISQTTQPIERVRSLVSAIRRARPAAEVRFVDTVCKPTKDRQRALQNIIAQAEVVVVVGGRESNNTRQLVETCRGAGRRAIHVERAEELRAADFARVAVVGLTAGTSTLPETVETVRERLLSFASSGNSGRTCGEQ